jgi:hypothetical protein
MHIIGVIVSSLLEVRAHIPNQPSFRSGPLVPSGNAQMFRGFAKFFVAVALGSMVVWLAIRLVMEAL